MKTVIKRNVIIICFILLQASACKKDEKLQLARTNYTGNELRIDGYYYYESIDQIHRSSYFF